MLEHMKYPTVIQYRECYNHMNYPTHATSPHHYTEIIIISAIFHNKFTAIKESSIIIIIIILYIANLCLESFLHKLVFFEFFLHLTPSYQLHTAFKILPALVRASLHFFHFCCFFLSFFLDQSFPLILQTVMIITLHRNTQSSKARMMEVQSPTYQTAECTPTKSNISGRRKYTHKAQHIRLTEVHPQSPTYQTDRSTPTKPNISD